MSLDAIVAKRGPSPTPSGRSTPALPTVDTRDQDLLRNDKSYRRYAAGIERALASFEPNQQEWADYIASLARLLKAIQATQSVTVLPHAATVCLRLAQCLHPALPSGVHQKALEVYSHIFSLISIDGLARHLAIYLPGLVPVLSFASLSIRPLYYTLLGDYVLQIDAASLRPATKSIILCLLPGIEDETSEDCDNGLALLDSFRQKIMITLPTDLANSDGVADVAPPQVHDGFFWQCFFLATITSPSRRQGALVYLIRKLPKLAHPRPNHRAAEVEPFPPLSPEAEALLRPEPGLLMRCFATGLRDPQILIQRGFLDLLVSHLPLHSHVLQHIVQPSDLCILVSAAMTVVLRREMSLNRRLWSWLLGPDSSTSQPDVHPMSPTDPTHSTTSLRQAEYFEEYGKLTLHACLMSLLQSNDQSRAKPSQPYRICLSLMDRREVAANLVPDVLLPALRHAYQLCLAKTNVNIDELLRSASLFFDAVESQLIWSKLVSHLIRSFHTARQDARAAVKELDFVLFVVKTFNIKEEDMLLFHIPNTILIVLGELDSFLSDLKNWDRHFVERCLTLVHVLALVVPAHAFTQDASLHSAAPASLPSPQPDVSEILRSIRSEYNDSIPAQGDESARPTRSHVGQAILDRAFRMFSSTVRSAPAASMLPLLVDSILLIFPKVSQQVTLPSFDIFACCVKAMSHPAQASSWSSHSFAVTSAVVSLITLSNDAFPMNSLFSESQIAELHPMIMHALWTGLSPSHPKYHVEAVRLLWQMESTTDDSDRVSSQLTSFLSSRMTNNLSHHEECGRFAVLWDLTMQPQVVKRKDYGSFSLSRRRSSAYSTADTMVNSPVPEEALVRPVLVLLDRLHDDDEDLVSYIVKWLQNLPTLDRVLMIILGRLTSAYESYNDQNRLHAHQSRSIRQAQHDVNEISHGMRHLLRILQLASMHSWQTIASLQVGSGEKLYNGMICAAKTCIAVLQMPAPSAHEAKQHSLLLLQILLESPNAAMLGELNLELNLMAALKTHLSKKQGALQTVMLDTLYKSLVLRASTLNAQETADNSQSRTSITKGQVHTRTSSSRSFSDPPSEVIRCITNGLASPTCRLHLESWVRFMAKIFPLYGNSILTAMMPLTDCLCKQVDIAFRYLVMASSRSAADVDGSMPNTALPSLLTGLELLLANPHLQTDLQTNTIPNHDKDHGQNNFGSMVPGLFATEGHEGRMSRINSRLTVILCIQDSLRMCFTIWNWANNRHETDKSETMPMATAALNSLKLRHRTKRMIENFFFAEGLECLEALIVVFREARSDKRDANTASTALALLHSLSASRPREILPIVLQSLYSRTSLDVLEPSKRSTLTCDLSALDIAVFLFEYVRTMEDDAMDEIWTECTGFLRDVLSNPMPHRLILPVLLELAVLIAEKIDNTNYGEQRKMHRELGDIFLRLLTATFTARPQDHFSPKLSTSDLSGKTTRQQNRGRDLLDSLVIVSDKLGIVLDGNDRVTTAVNAITSSIVNPSFHAKVFPENIGIVFMRLLQNVAKHGSEAKLWRKEVADAFNDARFFAMPPDLVHDGWFPVLRKWCLTEKDRLPDLLTRIVAPATAGIMFGVGANAARMEADRKTQTTLRRIAMLLLACDTDFFVNSIRPLEDKLAELLTASSSSSPSSATRADVFMVCRALVLCNTSTHIAGLWPLINSSLRETLSSLIAKSADQDVNNNVALLQASKLLDMLVILGPDDFQLHEWLYLSDTIDAVYRPVEMTSSALVDQIAESLTVDSASSNRAYEQALETTITGPAGAGNGQPFLASVQVDSGDVKAMAREDFVQTVLRSFFGQLGMYAYEATYGLVAPDVEACRRDLLKDLLDEVTIA